MCLFHLNCQHHLVSAVGHGHGPKEDRRETCYNSLSCWLHLESRHKTRGYDPGS
jgi:hypothetical protein